MQISGGGCAEQGVVINMMGENDWAEALIILSMAMLRYSKWGGDRIKKRLGVTCYLWWLEKERELIESGSVSKKMYFYHF